MCGSDGAVFGEKKERGEERDFQGKGGRDSRVKVVAGWKGRGGERKGKREKSLPRGRRETKRGKRKAIFIFGNHLIK